MVEKVKEKLRKPVLTSKKKKEEVSQEASTQQEEVSQTTDTPAEQAEEKSTSPPPRSSPVLQKPKEDPNRPVQMYISPDVRQNPPPTTVDGRYVAEHLGYALTLALSEISERRPWDPIEYLAHWLYKYQENANHNKRVIKLFNKTKSRGESEKGLSASTDIYTFLPYSLSSLEI